MKILNSVATVYAEALPLALSLKTDVDTTIQKIKVNEWHYFSRVKTIESFSLKIETGRVAEPTKMEDLFAGTLVVQNLKEVKIAFKLIEENFIVKYKRPKSESFTHKQPYSFQFDDLRLYLTKKAVSYMPVRDIDNIVFELQIKTFLQHAWGLSTHDLIYKSDQISWARQRVAYQIKAMLEQAEVAINGVDCLSTLPELEMEDVETQKLNKVLNFLKTKFKPEQLPRDLLRLTGNIRDLLANFKMSVSKLKELLDAENREGRGVHTLNLSPYSILLETIKRQDLGTFQDAFVVGDCNKQIFIPREIDLTGIQLADPTKIIST